MKRNLKALGLVLAAVFAIGASGAASVSANFTVEDRPATLTGANEGGQILEFTGIEIECEVAEYHAEMTERHQSTITFDPTFTECEGAGLNVTITGFTHNDPDESECHFILHTDGTISIDCAEGGEVTIEAATCIVHIPPQDGLGQITFTTKTLPIVGKHDLTLDVNVSEITATHTDGFLCPMTGSGEDSSGTLKGATTIWAEDADENLLHLTHHLAHGES